MAQVGDPPGVVEGVVADGDRLRAGQVGIAGDCVELAGGIVSQVSSSTLVSPAVRVQSESLFTLAEMAVPIHSANAHSVTNQESTPNPHSSK